MSLFSSSKKDNHSSAVPAVDRTSGAKAVAGLYDRLLETEANKISDDNWTIHKRLKFPPEEQGKGIHDSNDWIRRYVDIPAKAHILDAGCGVGGTLFALLNENRTGLGITLSSRQLAVAQNEAVRRQVAERCQFRQQSYDAPLGELFDFITSIESLAHSYHLAASIQNLSQHLKPGGQLLLLEDMACMDLSLQKIAQILQQSWCLQTVYTQFRYFGALEDAGLKLVQTMDLTPYVQFKPWPEQFIRLMWFLTQKMPTAWRGTKDVFVGGWALENLYRKGVMKYQILLARKV